MLENPISNDTIIVTIFVIAVFCGVAILCIKNLAKKYKEKE